MRRVPALLVALATAVLVACATARAPWLQAPAWAPRAGDAAQVVVVTPRQAPDRAWLQAWERAGEGWRAVTAPIPAMIGRNGFAPPGGKREGDGRTPTGTFPLRRAFGDGPEATRLEYRVVDAGDVWVDDAASPDYNRWVRRDATTAASFEDLLRRDEVYGRAIVVEYNTDPVRPGAGSAIFLHVWRADGRPTAGCVAVARPDLDRLLGWLDPAARPVLLLRDEDP